MVTFFVNGDDVIVKGMTLLLSYHIIIIYF